MILNKDNLWIGLAVGLLVPFVGYALLLVAYEQLEAMAFASDSWFSPNFRERTLAVIAICLNIIFMNRFRRRRMTESMRGVVFATMLYVFIWVVYFSGTLFQ